MIGGVGRSYSVSNRAFGKDITNKVLNQSGNLNYKAGSEMDKYRNSIAHKNVVRKPSPGVHSNY